MRKKNLLNWSPINTHLSQIFFFFFVPDKFSFYRFYFIHLFQTHVAATNKPKSDKEKIKKYQFYQENNIFGCVQLLSSLYSVNETNEKCMK